MAAEQSSDVTELKSWSVASLEGSKHSPDPEEFEPPSTSNSANEIKGIQFVLVVGALLLGVLCVALDNTILATAIPRITATYHTIDQIGWYGSAYLLTLCSFQLLYARLFRFIHVKRLFLAAMLIFEVGSLVCGIAPTSTAFVVGRAIAGLGAAGIFTGASTAVAQITTLKLRPLILGLVGAIYGLCSVVGPVLGGAFAEKSTWRWCFFINLPIGACTAAGVIFCLKIDQKLETLSGTGWARVLQLDPIGNALFVVSAICLLLAVEWAPTNYGWSNARTIVLFVVFGLGTITFVASQILWKAHATIPSRIASQRTVLFASVFAFFISSTVFVIIYYLPIWFQAINGLSPIMSAVHTLPMIISQLLGTFLSAGMTTRLGYYMPFVIASTILLAIGTGLLTTFYPSMPEGKWIGYQILLGLGVGFGFQMPNLAVQCALTLEDVPTGVAVAFTAQFLGGSVLLAAAQSIFEKQLHVNIALLDTPGFDATMAIDAGVSKLRQVVPPKYLHAVILAYNGAVIKVFEVALITACLTIIGAAGMEWRNVKIDKQSVEKNEADSSTY